MTVLTITYTVNMLTTDQKLLMAQMIFNEKEILFGKFEADLTRADKQEKWIEILVKLNSIGANIHDYKVSTFLLLAYVFTLHTYLLT